MSDFDALLDELNQLAAEPLAKANPDADDKQDDADIKAAADGDADDDGEADGDDATDDHDEPDGDEPLGKSFTVTLEDGTQVEAYDGQSAFQALQDLMADLRTETGQALSQIAQALGQSTSLIKSLRADNQALKSQLTAIGQQGRGRKSSLIVHDKAVGGGAADEQVTAPAPRDIMAKALDAQRAGRISGIDVARIDAYIGRGAPVPEPLLAQIGG